MVHAQNHVFITKQKMRNLAIALLVAGGLYYYFAQKKNDDTTEDEKAQTEPAGDVFRDYNNQVIVDSDGYWMLVKDGKLFTPTSAETLNDWFSANIGKEAITLKQQVWVLNLDKAAGSF